MHPFFVVSFLLSFFQVPFPVLLFVFWLFEVDPRYTYSCRSFWCLLFVWLGCLLLIVLVTCKFSCCFSDRSGVCWGWFFGLVRLVFLLDVVAVGVG